MTGAGSRHEYVPDADPSGAVTGLDRLAIGDLGLAHTALSEHQCAEVVPCARDTAGDRLSVGTSAARSRPGWRLNNRPRLFDAIALPAAIAWR